MIFKGVKELENLKIYLCLFAFTCGIFFFYNTLVHYSPLIIYILPFGFFLRNKIISCFLVGIVCSFVKFAIIKHDTINQNVFNVTISGRVNNIQEKDDKVNLIIREAKLHNVAYNNKYSLDPGRGYALSVSHKSKEKIEIGDKVIAKVNLFPFPRKIHPYSYNFARSYYFDGLDGMAFITEIISIERPKKFSNDLNSFIKKVQKYFTDFTANFTSQDESAVINGIILGKKTGMSEGLDEAIKNSGLSHLLSVSGFHVFLMISIIFFITRRGMTLMGNLAVRYNSKKIAAFSSIIFGLIYVIIVEYPYPAVRSYLMALIVLIGIICDINLLTIRNVILVFVAMLCGAPEAIYSISFQLSFTAVFVIIFVLREFFSLEEDGDLSLPRRRESGIRNYINELKQNTDTISKILLYFIGISLTSLFISLISMPIIAYHFNKISLISLLANLVAIPIVSFFTVPVCLLAFFFHLIHIDFSWLTNLASYSALVVEYICFYSAKLDNLIITNQTFSYTAASIMMGCIFGMMFTEIAIIWFVGFVFTLGYCFLSPKTVVIIDEKGQYSALKCQGDKEFKFFKLYGRAGEINKFLLEKWSEKLSLSVKIPAVIQLEGDEFTCKISEDDILYFYPKKKQILLNSKDLSGELNKFGTHIILLNGEVVRSYEYGDLEEL